MPYRHSKARPGAERRLSLIATESMHGHLTVTHDGGDFLGQLRADMPADSRGFLSRYPNFRPLANLGAQVAFATETPDWRIAVYSDGSNQWQVLVEAAKGNLRSACDSVWRTIHKATAPLKPRLARLELIDESTGRPLLEAGVGFLPQLKRRELWPAPIIALVDLAILVLAGAPSHLLLGCLPAFVGGLVVAAVIIIDMNRKELVWHP